MKIQSITVFCLFGLFLCSCNREELPESAANKETVLHAGLVSVQTKTWLDSEGSMGNQTKKVYWSDGDKINVNGQDSTPVSVSDGEKVSEADFHLKSVDGPYNVIYPHDIVLDETYDEAGCVTISLASSQIYHPTTFASGAAVMYGYSENKSVALHNLCAAVRVNLTGTSNVSAATVVSESSDAPICGTFKLCPQTGVLTPADGKVSLSLDFEDVSLSPEGTDFYFTIPAGDYSAGLSFYFTNAGDGRKMQCVWKPEAALEAGRLYSFNEVAYAPEAKDIETAEEWEEFVLALAGEGDLGKFLYKDGVVRLGADIECEDLTPVTEDFTYIFDGKGKTITRTNAKAALFSSVSGTVKNLTLAGNFEATASQGDAPFVSILAPGGTISGSTNEMTITFDNSDHAYVAGIVKKMTGGTIENCVNNGEIKVKLSGNKNVGIGGIVGQADGSGEDMIIKDCINKQKITFAPVIATENDGSPACGVGGVVGWLRRADSFTLENCDNEATVTYSAENITSTLGANTYPICLGGIIGVGSTYNDSVIDDVNNGIKISISDCDNSGTVYNCGVVNTTNKASGKRAFTGGLAGFLLGQDENYASISSCTNTGAVYTYNLTGEGASTMPYFSSVAGGFIGFGGYLNMDKCTINCLIGCKERALMSLGGVIGLTVRPFTLINSNVHIEGYYNRISNYQNNRAVVASVPTYYGGNTNNPMTITPDITGSIISKCKLGGHIYTTSSALTTANGAKTDDLSGNDYSVTLFNSTDKATEGAVVGQGYTTVATDVTIEDITYWNGK